MPGRETRELFRENEEFAVARAWVLGAAAGRDGDAQARAELQILLQSLRPADFLDPWCRAAWEATLEVAREEGPEAVNYLTALSRLAQRGRLAQGMLAWASRITTEVPPLGGQWVAQLVWRQAQARRAAQVAHRLAEGEAVPARDVAEMARYAIKDGRFAFRDPPQQHHAEGGDGARR